METKKTAIFFRVDHPTLKSVVESFGDEVNEEEIKVVGHKTRELIDSGIIDYGLGYDYNFIESLKLNIRQKPKISYTQLTR